MLNARALGSMPIPILEKPLAIDLREIGALEAELRSTADQLSDKAEIFIRLQRRVDLL